ncbi:MAG TPA: hypothetical protein VN844_19310 [Pyrinomonadaceae bacterium]|nr:hypothetical protein [Pyrinomonadaceae bacterium]
MSNPAFSDPPEPDFQRRHVGFSKLIEGDEELVHGKIIKCLICKHREYIVYLDNNYGVWWATDDKENCFDSPGAGEILNEVSYLEGVDVSTLKSHQVLAFRRMLGEAVARLLDVKDVKQAKRVLTYARDYIAARNAENVRLWYLSASGIATLVAGVTIWVIWLAQYRLHVGPKGIEFALAIGGGALGAFLSILLRSESVPKDISAGKKLYYAEAIAKVLAGMIGALLVALGIETKLFFGNVVGEPQLALMVMFGIVAGMSERLVPSLVTKVELTNSGS